MATASAPDGAPIILAPLDARSPWRWFSVLATGLVAAVVAWQLAHLGFSGLVSLLPGSPWFFVLLGMIYLTLPLSECLIFRRLWGVPWTVIGPLMRKTAINDLVFSYGGELYLYTWARTWVRAGAPPFAAIKDVSILSAVAANLVTLAMLGLAAPWLGDLLPPEYVHAVIASAVVLLLVPLGMKLFATRIFSLAASELRFVAFIHVIRILATGLLTATLWAAALPQTPLVIWFMLQTVRMLTSRLPLVPNKDLLFASVTALLIGRDSEIAALISLTALATVALHLLVLTTSVASDFIHARLR